MWVQVPSSALERKQSRSKDLLFFRSNAEEFLELRVQGRLRSTPVGEKPRSPRPRAPRPDGLRRSVRREKGSLDLFLNPSHFALRSTSVGAKQTSPRRLAPHLPLVTG